MRFDAQTVIAPLELTVEDGAFFTFAGPSGCGKRTLLALLAGIETPSAGTSTRYAAIYSSFAILLFLIWLYVSWLILLVGADVAFYRQHPQYLVAEAPPMA